MEQVKNKVKSRKALEKEGLAVIDSNDFWQFDDAKYVLNIVQKGLVFKQTGTYNYPAQTISECLEIYNKGLIEDDKWVLYHREEMEKRFGNSSMNI